MNKKKIILVSILLILIFILSFFIVFVYEMSPVNKKSEDVIEFTVEKGWGKNKIVTELEKVNLIRNDFFAKLILKFTNK